MEGVFRRHRLLLTFLCCLMAALLLTILWYPDHFSTSRKGTQQSGIEGDIIQHEESALFSPKALDVQDIPPASVTHKPDPPTGKPSKLEKPPKPKSPVSLAPNRTEVNEALYPDTTVEKEWISIEDSSNGLTLARRTVYYDTRSSFSPSVVIIVLHNHEKQPNLPKLYAKVTGQSSCSAVEHWKQTGNVVKSPWYEVTLSHMYRIQLNERPESIQLSKDSQCNKLLPLMPVFKAKEVKKKYTFTTCIQKALYDDIQPAEVVNFIELNRALGSSMITIYFHRNLKAKDAIYKAIETYIKTGYVEVLGWSLADGWLGQVFDVALSASATECVYRHMAISKYMALHDVDEFLIPMKHEDWFGMLNELKNKNDLSKYASLSFANSLFQEKEEAGPKMECAVPIYFKRYLRDDDPKTSHPKVMVNLNITITAYCHDIKTWKDGAEKELLVPFEIGLLFHYRKQLGQRVNVAQRWKHDTIVNKYMDTVIAALRKNSCITK